MATELSSQHEQVSKQGVPVCDACRAYECKVQFPGEYEGSYYKHPTGGISAIKREGILCILHYGDMKKDSEKSAEAVRRKLEAKDFDFRSVQHPGDVKFSGELQNADFSGAQIGGRVDFRKTTFGGPAFFFGWPSAARQSFLGRPSGVRRSFS